MNFNLISPSIPEIKALDRQIDPNNGGGGGNICFLFTIEGFGSMEPFIGEFNSLLAG